MVDRHNDLRYDVQALEEVGVEDMNLIEIERANVLLDHLGELLEPQRRETMRLYYAEDMSLAEIADELSISRQAVHARIRQDLQFLETAERALNLISCRQEILHLTQQLAESMVPNEEQHRLLLAIEQLALPGAMND